MSEVTIDESLNRGSRHYGSLQVRSFATRDAMGEAAANDIAKALRTRLQTQDHVRMIFAAAPSQADMLKMLCAAPDIDWSRVTAFHMDEYIGLSLDHPARFGLWLDRHIFDQLPFGNIHRIMPDNDPVLETKRYASLLKDAPIDFICLGIGVNGHIAFNDPPVARFDDPETVKIVKLDDVCRQQQVDDKCFATFNDVPEQAITLTIPCLMGGEQLFCVVPGIFKQNAVRDTLYGKITTDCPASILRNHPSCTLYLDKDSDPDA
ncbi:glucosamine-6-phosphate deaminase [Brucellaceae bacterium C25G]